MSERSPVFEVADLSELRAILNAIESGVANAGAGRGAEAAKRAQAILDWINEGDCGSHEVSQDI